MTRRLIHSAGLRNAAPVMTAKVYRDSETCGFVVLFFKNGKHRPQADYETDSRADAIQTADLSCEMANTARQS